MSQAALNPVSFWRRRLEVFAGFVAAGSILTLSARQWWVADLLANLRVQLIIGMLGTVFLLLIMRRWKMMWIVTTLTLWQAAALHSAVRVPFSRFEETRSAVGSSADAEGGVRLRVFLANVLARNQHHTQMIEQMRAAAPDVIAILELSSALEDSLQREFSLTHPHFVSEAQDNGNFGIGLWSRYPLSHAQVFHLNAPILPSIEADIQLPLCAIHVMVTHPLPPMGARNFGHRNQHLALLAQRIRKQQQAEPSRAMLLLGDLNLTPWSPLFEDFLEATRLQNSAAGRGLQPTWYRWNAFPFGLLLDHGLHSENLRCDQRGVLPANGSDHRAVVFDFSVNESR